MMFTLALKVATGLQEVFAGAATSTGVARTLTHRREARVRILQMENIVGVGKTGGVNVCLFCFAVVGKKRNEEANEYASCVFCI